MSLVLTLTLLGCVKLTDTVAPQDGVHSRPEWAKNPPADTSSYWYGIGSGFGRDLAIKHALSDIASRLKVAVQSEVEMHTFKETTDGQAVVNERFKAVNKLSTGEVNFPGYEVQRTEELDGNTHVLIAVERNKFVQQYVRNIEAAARTVREGLERFSTKQPIEQYIGKSELQESAYQLLALTDLLAAADKSFSAKAQDYRRQASDAFSYLAKSKNRLKFYIVADTKSRYLVTAMRELFNQEQLPVTESKKSGDTLVKLASTPLSKGRDSIGGYEISIKTQIIMQTTNGHVVGNRILTLYGASTNNYEYAMRALADDLKEKIENEGGIFAFLNSTE